MVSHILKLNKKDLVKINRNVTEGCSLNLVSYENNEFDIVYRNKKHFLPHIANIKFNK